MSTAKKHSTKSSKPKTTRRAPKPARPKLNAFARRRCEVALIADEQDVLQRTWDHCNEMWAKAPEKEKAGWIRRCDCVGGTMRGNIERARSFRPTARRAPYSN